MGGSNLNPIDFWAGGFEIGSNFRGFETVQDRRGGGGGGSGSNL